MSSFEETFSGTFKVDMISTKTCWRTDEIIKNLPVHDKDFSSYKLIINLYSKNLKSFAFAIEIMEYSGILPSGEVV